MKRTIFDDEHRAYRESVRRFLAEEVLPNHAQWEREGIVPRELFAKAAEHGLLAMSVPERYGGAGAEDFRFNQIVVEEVAYAGVAGSGLGITLPGPGADVGAVLAMSRRSALRARYPAGHLARPVGEPLEYLIEFLAVLLA